MKRTRTNLSRGALGLALAVVALALPLWGEEAAPSSNLMLVGIAESDGAIYASVVDSQTGKHFLPTTRGADGGIELVSVTEGVSAVIRQNGQLVRLRLGWPSNSATVQNDFQGPATAAQSIPRPGGPADGIPTPPPGQKLPLVFQTTDSQISNFTDAQIGIINSLRSQFLATIGAGGTSSAAAALGVPGATAGVDSNSTSTPFSSLSPDAQASTWSAAQQEIDDLLRMRLGYQGFNAYEEGLHGRAP